VGHTVTQSREILYMAGTTVTTAVVLIAEETLMQE